MAVSLPPLLVTVRLQAAVRSSESVKVTLSLCTSYRHMGKVGVSLHLFLTSILDGGEWSATRRGRFTPRVV